ncbi:hypothetical protein D1872_338910 [compost metagenome]
MSLGRGKMERLIKLHILLLKWMENGSSIKDFKLVKNLHSNYLDWNRSGERVHPYSENDDGALMMN